MTWDTVWKPGLAAKEGMSYWLWTSAWPVERVGFQNHTQMKWIDLYTGRNQCLKVIKRLYMLIMSYWRYECKNGTVTSIVELMLGVFPTPEAALAKAALSVFWDSLIVQPGWLQTHGPLILASHCWGLRLQVGAMSCGSCCCKVVATVQQQICLPSTPLGRPSIVHL